MKKDKKFDEQSLGGRLKGYEKEYESIIEPEKHIILRIDGHHFSKYTKGFTKPYDEILARAMVETTKDLVERFDAYTGYCQSDEITIFFPSLKDVTVDNRKKKTHKIHKRIRDDWEHSFGGRVQKMTSLVAAFTTMSFNKHFRKLLLEEYDLILKMGVDDSFLNKNLKLQEKVGNAYFDCRVFGVPDEDEVFNSFMWRVRDCVKNSRSMFAQAECSHKELHGKTGQEQVEYTLEKTGKDWNLVDDMYKYGTFVKKELYEKEVDYRDLNYSERKKYNTPEHPTVTRSRICTFSTKLTSYSEEGVKMIMSQYKTKDF
jgi:tRNA(His) guanylyltransferase